MSAPAVSTPASWREIPAGIVERDWQVAAYHVQRGAELPPFDTAIQYLLAAEGLYKRSRSPYFEACVPLMHWRRRLPGLTPVRAGVTLHIPRLPGRWLAWALEAARRVCGAGPCELLLQVVVRRGQVVIDLPAQQATATHLAFAHAPGSVLCDLHSHHELPACFSSLDDQDETGLRFYAVMGHIFSCPTLRMRVGVYGDRMQVPVTTLFESAGSFADACAEVQPSSANQASHG